MKKLLEAYKRLPIHAKRTFWVLLSISYTVVFFIGKILTN